jgi:hypothetical protein
MGGMNLSGRGGGSVSQLNSVMAVSSSPMASPAAVVAYGPGGSAVGNAGPGVLNNSSGSTAIYIGAVALGFLVFARQHHPNKRDFDQDVFTVILISLALRGAVFDAKRRVLEGKTSGVTGAASQAVALL